MQPKLIAAGIITLALVLAVLLTTWYILFAQPGRVSHASLVNERTALRMSFQPFREQRYISSLTNSATRFVKGVPRVTSLQARAFRVDGIHTLPYELTLLVERPDDEGYPTTLFMNPLPDSEGFLHEVDRPGFFSLLRFAQWEGSRFRQPEEGVYLAEGSLGDSRLLGGGVDGVGVPDFSGDHLFELSADNRNGVGSSLFESVTQGYGALFPREFYDAFWAVLQNLATARVQADKTDADVLTVGFQLDGLPSADMDAFLEAADRAAFYMAEYLDQRFQVEFRGRWQQEGMRRLVATYTLSGWEGRLRRALGG